MNVLKELIDKLEEFYDWAEIYYGIDSYTDYVKFVDGEKVYVDESDPEAKAYPSFLRMDNAELHEARYCAKEIYVLAAVADLDRFLPQEENLIRKCIYTENSKIRFETWLDLPVLPVWKSTPANFYYEFCQSGLGYWLECMDTLLRIAKAKLSSNDKQPVIVKIPETGGTEWKRQVEVVRGLYPTTVGNKKEFDAAKMKINRLVRKGVLKTNDKLGPARRIDPASILAYCEREGIAWNDT